MGLPASLLTSLPPSQVTTRSIWSPYISVESDKANPSITSPSGFWISTRTLPAAEVEKLIASSFPSKSSGFVTTSPPVSGAWAETNPSRRSVKRRIRQLSPW